MIEPIDNSETSNEDFESVGKKMAELEDLLSYVKRITKSIELKQKELTAKILNLSQSAQCENSLSLNDTASTGTSTNCSTGMPLLSPQIIINVRKKQKGDSSMSVFSSKLCPDISSYKPSLDESDHNMPDLAPFDRTPKGHHSKKHNLDNSCNPFVSLIPLSHSVVKKYQVALIKQPETGNSHFKDFNERSRSLSSSKSKQSNTRNQRKNRKSNKRPKEITFRVNSSLWSKT